MQSSIQFKVEATCPWSGARAGTIHTPHGSIKTPAFMPIATRAVVKTLTAEQVKSTGAEIILGNSYHLYLRPGCELIQAAGGLHKFMSWNMPILTDSGGFQVFSLKDLRTITEQGVTFKDHLSGKTHFIGPEESMKIQNAIGADIIMAFDDCIKNPATYDQTLAAMERTHRWLEVCTKHHQRDTDQALFGIVQGGTYEELRRESAKIVTAYDLPGFAIGGVAVGEDRATIERTVAFTAPLLPVGKPRYLMGIGTPWDVVYATRCGIDMFDCVLPTRLARHGAAFTNEGRVSLRNARFRTDFGPLDDDCNCYTCKTYSRAYLHHIVKLKDATAASLLSMHNIIQLIKYCGQARDAVIGGTFKEYFENTASKWAKDLEIDQG
jgi:queuine tRNA-ribosyltransferase